MTFVAINAGDLLTVLSQPLGDTGIPIVVFIAAIVAIGVIGKMVSK